MRGLTGYALRSLSARPLRTTLSLAGVALGVAVLVASLATNAGIEAAIDRTVAETGGTADLRVAAFREDGLGAETVAAIEATPGVAVAAPALERRTFLGPEQFGAGDELPAPVTILAIDPEREPAVRALVLRDGRQLNGRDALGVLVTEPLADQDGLRLGSKVVIQGAAEVPPLRAEVVGILAGGGPVLDPAGRVVVMPLVEARTLFATERVNRVDLAFGPATDAASVVTALEQRLSTEPYVLTTAEDVATSLRASTADFQGMTGLIAAVTLFAGAFLIFNTLSMTLSERSREIGLLRAAGATRGQLTRTVLVQGVALGSVGALAGVAVGAILGTVLGGLVGRVGSVVVERAVFEPSAILGGLLAGLAVTIVAAIEPARRAGRVSPVEALRPGLRDAVGRRAHLPWVVGVFAAIALLGLLVWPPAGGSPALARAAAVYALLLLATLALPLMLPSLVRVAGLPFALLVRLEERLARASLIRDLSRAALTTGALAVALAMLVALAAVSQQARRSADGWLETVVPGELLLSSIRPIPLDEGVGELVASFTGVERVSPIATFETAVDGRRVDAAAVVGADLADDGRLDFVSGERDTALAALDAGGATILSSRIAQRLGAGVGDTLRALAGGGGTIPLRVAGIVERTLPGRTGDTMLVGWADATTSLGVAGADAFAIRFEPGSSAAVRESVALDARSLALDPASLGEIRTAIGDALDRVFVLFDALALVAVVVAGLGIVNTLSMNVLERVREIGVLRSVGMTRRQVWRMVVVEAGICGLAGAIVGCVTGLLVGGSMVVLAGGRPSIEGVLPVPALAAALVFGVGFAMLAAAWPARLASGLPIVRAVRYE